MIKTLSGLTPIAGALVAFGAVVGVLLSRNVGAGRWLLAAFLVGHGWVHAMFLVPGASDATEPANGGENPFDMAQSWLVTGAGIDLAAVRVIGAVIIVAVLLGFALSGLATVDVLVPVEWWRGLVVASTAGSLLLIVMFFSPSLVLGFGIAAVLLWLALGTGWVPER